MEIKIYNHTMHALKQLIFIAFLAGLTLSIKAQNKYALLIGINDYYEVKGVKSKESLNGSVNDANAIRQLLTVKFGFKRANIDTIYNAAATRDNIIEGLKKKLRQSKPGDLVVFYFSGHGVWMQNSQLKADPVKRGMNQAMLTSDLYNYGDQFKCFLRDFTLKQYFNLFIDKKVMLTTIFDCCFSGNLAMTDRESVISNLKSKSVDFNDLMSRLTENVEDPQQLMDSITGITVETPAGCLTDSTGAITNNLDSDKDGVPDCKDKEKLTSLECFPVSEDGIGKCPFDFLLQKTLNQYDAAELEKNNQPGLPVIGERVFNAREVLSISEKDTIARPAERKNSMFLFISATTDAQKALEFKNEDNKIHGLFTASILRVFNRYPASTPADELFIKIKQDMESFGLKQNPTIYGDPARLKNNLIGIKPK